MLLTSCQSHEKQRNSALALTVRLRSRLCKKKERQHHSHSCSAPSGGRQRASAVQLEDDVKSPPNHRTKSPTRVATHASHKFFRLSRPALDLALSCFVEASLSSSHGKASSPDLLMLTFFAATRKALYMDFQSSLSTPPYKIWHSAHQSETTILRSSQNPPHSASLPIGPRGTRATTIESLPSVRDASECQPSCASFLLPSWQALLCTCLVASVFTGGPESVFVLFFSDDTWHGCS